jgi:hypothetical protein
VRTGRREPAKSGPQCAVVNRVNLKHYLLGGAQLTSHICAQLGVIRFASMVERGLNLG